MDCGVCRQVVAVQSAIAILSRIKKEKKERKASRCYRLWSRDCCWMRGSRLEATAPREARRRGVGCCGGRGKTGERGLGNGLWHGADSRRFEGERREECREAGGE